MAQSAQAQHEHGILDADAMQIEDNRNSAQYRLSGSACPDAIFEVCRAQGSILLNATKMFT